MIQSFFKDLSKAPKRKNRYVINICTAVKKQIAFGIMINDFLFYNNYVKIFNIINIYTHLKRS